MALLPWECASDVCDLFYAVKQKYHHPRLEMAEFAICFVDTKPFVRGRFNWGKVQKFSPLARLWHADNKKRDFLVILCADAWHSVLNIAQREALLDLHLTRCDVEYVPQTVEENGKKQVVKDEFGRVQMSDEVKYDDDGVPKWKVQPLDLHVFTENVTRYGIWCEDLLSFKDAVEAVEDRKIETVSFSPANKEEEQEKLLSVVKDDA